MTGKYSLLLVVLICLSGCKVGPNYERPPIAAPEAYRGLAPELPPQSTASLGDEKWWTIFKDEQLQGLVREAISQNYDVRIAAARVLQAQAQVVKTLVEELRLQLEL